MDIPHFTFRLLTFCLFPKVIHTLIHIVIHNNLLLTSAPFAPGKGGSLLRPNYPFYPEQSQRLPRGGCVHTLCKNARMQENRQSVKSEKNVRARVRI